MSAFDELVADALGDDEGVNYSTEDTGAVCSIDRPSPWHDPAGWHASIDEQVRAERIPYVGSGADGCRRSAQIDREEVDCLDLDDPRRAELLSSAERWEAQAESYVAWSRDERDPCEKGTIGCSVRHDARAPETSCEPY